jgi:hypothetical protein
MPAWQQQVQAALGAYAREAMQAALLCAAWLLSSVCKTLSMGVLLS